MMTPSYSYQILCNLLVYVVLVTYSCILRCKNKGLHSIEKNAFSIFLQICIFIFLKNGSKII